MDYLDHLSSAPPARILVVGDLMLDRYMEGSVDRISPEAPVPVLRHTASREMLGGAGNVAANIASLGGKVELVIPYQLHGLQGDGKTLTGREAGNEVRRRDDGGALLQAGETDQVEEADADRGHENAQGKGEEVVHEWQREHEGQEGDGKQKRLEP